MIIENLKLINFRNYDQLEIEFSPHLNFIIGENGSGKTNIIEAISILSGFRSFKNISDSDIVKWGCDSYYCKGEIIESDYKKFEVGFFKDKEISKKKVKIDGSEISKISEFYGRFLTVVFSPDDINIINGTPELRRRFFDSVISKIYPDYINDLNNFRHILNSRNTMLKNIANGQVNIKQIEVWDELFASKAMVLIKKRREFIEIFNKVFSKIYSNISNDDTCEFFYTGLPFDKKEDFLEFLNKKKSEDLKKKTTTFGPQRDDYILKKDDINFTNYSSQGQKRAASVSLKVSEIDIIENISGKKSVILVDDIFSELDEKRRNNMIDSIKNKGQIIFTMVSFNKIEDLSKDYKIFEVNKGKLKFLK
ncbi:MAG TPA: DNA replication/repair protein RecF [Spirochaetota bacterium]|nr:DNA replication/repair protein RecF [Spirochaetota bacterium]HRS61557.1 DNA replication/repair protein RecF [Spirochaetota bacterium]